MSTSNKTNIAVFASGAGTNAANIIQYFKQKNTANVVLIISTTFTVFSCLKYWMMLAALVPAPDAKMAIFIFFDVDMNKCKLNTLKAHNLSNDYS